ncbi:MAG: ribonuclease P protein component [Candidatus Gracilibacteria bacterium]|nr:ribonuclease P protein component [Candidatus Gracilibacteria bacterium]MDD2908293.1 ribonuclease P protein component [Candidatus Gracilibacteria bacterium]
MIKKIFRLNESGIKKVLKFKKPFFSYGFIANVTPNRLPYSRFAIFLSSKNVKTAVCRNYFRRLFYSECSNNIGVGNFDIVFVPKKGKIFDKNDKTIIFEFEKDIKFLFKKIFNK